MKSTIKDVARKAGVSTATVSMVLSGKGKISEQKKEAVIDAINELGYKRQRSASKNNPHKKKYVGLIVFCDFSFQWWFVKDIVLSIKEKFMQDGIYTLMFYCDHDTDSQELFDEIMDADVCGVLILHLNDHSFFTRLVSQNMPVVLVNNSNYQSEFNTVCADDYQGAYEGTKKILSKGHKKIIYLEYNRPSQPATIIDRFFGFKKALEEVGIPFPDHYRLQLDLEDPLSLEKKLGELLQNDKDITACFIHDDYYAVRVIKILKGLGYRVPDDLSIIAPGDTLPYHEPFIPPISTMQINMETMADQAVKMLGSLLEHPNQSLQVIKTIEQYVDRGSCI